MIWFTTLTEGRPGVAVTGGRVTRFGTGVTTTSKQLSLNERALMGAE